MKRYAYQGRMLTVNELAEISGVLPHTLRDRLRRGYPIEQAVKPSPIHESVEQFCEASCWEDWIGISISDLYGIYWKWCIQHGYSASSKQGFSRHINTLYPHLKTVPTQKINGCERIIRERG